MTRSRDPGRDIEMQCMDIKQRDGIQDASGNQPSVGAVIVNFNGGKRILRVLDALHRQQYPLADIIVVDNDSNDSSPAEIRAAFPKVRIIELGMNTGLSNARNVGLRALHTTLAFIIDHDIYADENCIAIMIRAYEAERPAVMCPRIRLLPEREIVQVEGASAHFLGTLILRHGYQQVKSTPALPQYVDGSPGGCMLVERERIIDAGGFDELFFFYLEDLEFTLRLRGMGYRFWCEPAAEVFHERASGTPGLSFRGQGQYPERRAYFTMRNRLLAMLIHYRTRTLLVLLPVLVLYELVAFAAALRKGFPAQWLRAWQWQFANFRTIVQRRRTVRRRRTVDDKNILIGGTPPLTPGFLTSRMEERLLTVFSRIVNGYWTVARHWIA
jgi:GT2 family glycosyltransferase